MFRSRTGLEMAWRYAFARKRCPRSTNRSPSRHTRGPPYHSGGEGAEPDRGNAGGAPRRSGARGGAPQDRSAESAARAHRHPARSGGGAARGAGGAAAAHRHPAVNRRHQESGAAQNSAPVRKQNRVYAPHTIDATTIASRATAPESASVLMSRSLPSGETARGRHPGRFALGRRFADPFLRVMLAREHDWIARLSRCLCGFVKPALLLR